MTTLQGTATYIDTRPPVHSDQRFDFGGAILPNIPSFGMPAPGPMFNYDGFFKTAQPLIAPPPHIPVPPPAPEGPAAQALKKLNQDPPRKNPPRSGELQEEAFGDPQTQAIANPPAQAGSKALLWLILAGTAYAAYHYSRKGA